MASRDYGVSGFFVRPRATLLALVLTSITLVTVSYKSHGSGIGSVFQSSLRSITVPIRSTTNSVVRPVENIFNGIVNYSSLKRQNVFLSNEVRTLKNQSTLASKYQEEVQKLSSLVNLPFAQGIPSVAALVDNYSPSNTQLTVDLSKGSSAGIRVGEPVVSALGLIGRVVSVGRSSSTVLLVADPSSSIGVSFNGGKNQALEVGTGSFTSLKVDLVNPGTHLVSGEIMYTSGLQGGLFPPGVPVGKVTKYSSFAGALQEQVTLSPMADLAHLQYVSVLDWLPGGGK